MLFVLNIILFNVLEAVWPHKTASPPTSRALIKAGAVVVLFVALAVGYESSQWEPNYFEVLGVPRTASSRDIRMAWKDISKTMHPDVNPAPDAADEFVKLTKIKETLTSPKKRAVYDRWGPKMLEHQHHEELLNNPLLMAFVHAQAYGGILLFAVMITLDRARSRALMWCIALIGVALYFELNLKHDDEDWDVLMAVLPQWTIHEKTALLHIVLYFGINLLANWASRTFMDLPEMRFQNLANNQVFMAKMIEELRAEVAELGGGRKKAQGEAGPVADGKELQRQAKVNKFKNAKYKDEIAAAQAAQQQGGGWGVNWINLAILLLTLYSQTK